MHTLVRTQVIMLIYPPMCVCYSALSRLKLDRRRLEAAHFKYAILNITSWYADKMESKVTFSPDLNETLLQFIPVYQRLFHTKYSGIYMYIHRDNMYMYVCTLVHYYIAFGWTQVIVAKLGVVELFLFWTATKRTTVLYVQQVMQVTLSMKG